jgi:DNA-binding NarL/FixJ family response regulator
MIKKKTILIVDDHPFIREGLKAIIGRIIGADAQYEVVGEAATGHEALTLAKDLKPDICLMDISLPDQNGIELTREICRLLPKTRVLILSMHSKVDYIAEAIQAGASGYLVKDSAYEKLLQALDWVSKGEYYLDTAVSGQVVKQLRSVPKKEKVIADKDYRTLTQREHELMKMLAEGMNIEEIANKLFISPKTVKNHRASIMAKLSLHSHYELVRYAAKLGLIDVDLWKV